MSSIKIQATEYPIQKVFSNDFVFTIPLYQRPYAWNTEQAGELLEDLMTSLGDGKEPIDDVNPYFLGSIVLIKEKEDKPHSQVVDGQQRLTTLTILLAVLRTLLDPKFANALTKLLYEESDELLGIPNRYHLTLVKRDAEFFKQYIQDEGGISKLKSLNSASLSDSCKNIKENALSFLKRLEKIPNTECFRIAQFIIKRCFLVVVSTPDLDSAYRIFSVLNDRGLDLSLTDILKAEIIGQIPDQKEKYANMWDNLQEDLGRNMFQSLFTHIRMIYKKAKPKESILKEIRQYVHPTVDPEKFINEKLCPYANSYSDIIKENYQHNQYGKKLNNLFRWLNLVDNSDWIPPAILYLSQQYNNPEALVHFFTDLERLAAGLMIQRANINERIERYSKLLSTIEGGDNLYINDSPLQLTNQERRDILKVLNDDVYSIQKIRLFVLLRLDATLSKGEAAYLLPTISVEHVLPQNPASNSVWLRNFTNEEHEKYVHRLGNLVLLSRRKNSEAQNYDFQRKKEKYFTTSTGVSPFALTTQVLQEHEWTPAVIAQRQKKLIAVLKQVWRL